MDVEVPATAAAATTAPPALELAWSPSTMTDTCIEALIAQGLLPEKAISGWRSCTREAFPSEDRTKIVIFQSFYEKGFGLPSGVFFRERFSTTIATFIHLCERFLGIVPHFNLWRALYHLRVYPNKDTPDVLGSAAFLLRQGGKYPEAVFKDSNKR
ncbi:orf3 [Panicum miliaceum]|uniref:Orf3 n=1 Tax=Panicum miliaceum TaxID=4540 RepID=A0A3L6TK74_PANMI|nr:orf3 [Panicum miliaceum]